MKLDIRISLLMVSAILVGLIVGCGPAADQNNESATENDSAEVNTRRTTEPYTSGGRGIEDSVIADFVRRYPEMEFAYLPTDKGKVTTVKGNYQVSVDGIKKENDLNELVRYLEQKYESRAIERAEFNKGIDTPAKPERGYEAYYDVLSQNLKYPDEAKQKHIKATIFVELLIDEKGTIAEVDVVENTYHNKNADALSAIEQAAVKAVQSTQWKWIPAQKAGKPVKMKVEIPIQFVGQE